MHEAHLQGTTCRLASGAFLVRDYDAAVDLGRVTRQESMAKAWPRMLKLTAGGAAVFLTEGGATVQVLERRQAVFGPDDAEALVRVRFVGATDAELNGEFWMTEKALEPGQTP